MRTTPLHLAVASVFGLALMLVASPASADVAGTYDVKYEEVSTNCASPLVYPHGKLEITRKGTTVTVDIDRTPPMSGSVGKNGKVSAKSKRGKTSLGGMDGVFSVAGRVTPEGMLTFVMIGEYTAGGKSLCSQSWNVTGAKADKPAQAPAKKKAAASSAFVLPAFFQ